MYCRIRQIVYKVGPRFRRPVAGTRVLECVNQSIETAVAHGAGCNQPLRRCVDSCVILLCHCLNNSSKLYGVSLVLYEIIILHNRSRIKNALILLTSPFSTNDEEGDFVTQLAQTRLEHKLTYYDRPNSSPSKHHCETFVRRYEGKKNIKSVNWDREWRTN